MTAGPVGRNDATAAFFDAAASGHFLLLRCPEGHWNRPQASACSTCGATSLSPATASGRARLVSWAVVHDRSGAAPPRLPAIVELEEGPWWWTCLAGADPAALAEGMALRVAFERPEGSEAVPVFEPAGS